MKTFFVHGSSFWLYRLRYPKIEDSGTSRPKPTVLCFDMQKSLQDWNHTAQAEMGLGLMALNLNQLDIGERRFQEVLNRAEEKSDIPVMLTCFHYICAIAWQKEI